MEVMVKVKVEVEVEAEVEAGKDGEEKKKDAKTGLLRKCRAE